VLAGCLVIVLSSAAGLAAADLRVGAAAVNIPADDSMVIGGGIGPGRATGQEGELRATAVALSHGGQGAILVSCDVLFVERDFVESALKEIESSCGVAASNVLISATHTHHAPTTATVHGYTRDEKFVASLKTAIVKAATGAWANLREGRFFYKLGEENTVGANSRVLLSDNTIWWTGPRDDAVRPTGPFDPQLPVLSLRGERGDLVALVYNHSTHTIGTRTPGVRSPGFYGLAAQELEAELGGVAAFFEGASGSTHNITAVPCDEAVRRMKHAVRAALDKAEPREVTRLASIKRHFEFKVRTFDEAVEEAKVARYCRKRIPEHADAVLEVFRAMRNKLAPQQGTMRTTVIQTIVIGDVAIVGVPAEYFTLFGVDIKRRSPYRDTVVVELANDWIGYLPDREAHKLGGYQTWMGLQSYAEEGTGERVADTIVSMLEEMSKP
jgi:hypothetical protein